MVLLDSPTLGHHRSYKDSIKDRLALIVSNTDAGERVPVMLEASGHPRAHRDATIRPAEQREEAQSRRRHTQILISRPEVDPAVLRRGQAVHPSHDVPDIVRREGYA
jgi:hypothetical protein